MESALQVPTFRARDATASAGKVNALANGRTSVVPKAFAAGRTRWRTATRDVTSAWAGEGITRAPRKCRWPLSTQTSAKILAIKRNSTARHTRKAKTPTVAPWGYAAGTTSSRTRVLDAKQLGKNLASPARNTTIVLGVGAKQSYRYIW